MIKGIKMYYRRFGPFHKIRIYAPARLTLRLKIVNLFFFFGYAVVLLLVETGETVRPVRKKNEINNYCFAKICRVPFRFISI